MIFSNCPWIYQNLPSLFNLWTDKTLHVNLSKKLRNRSQKEQPVRVKWSFESQIKKEKRIIFEKKLSNCHGKLKKPAAKSNILRVKNCRQNWWKKTRKPPVNFPTETLWKIYTHSEVKFWISSQKNSWNKITLKR